MPFSCTSCFRFVKKLELTLWMRDNHWQPNMVVKLLLKCQSSFGGGSTSVAAVLLTTASLFVAVTGPVWLLSLLAAYKCTPLWITALADISTTFMLW